MAELVELSIRLLDKAAACWNCLEQSRGLTKLDDLSSRLAELDEACMELA